MTTSTLDTPHITTATSFTAAVVAGLLILRTVLLFAGDGLAAVVVGWHAALLWSNVTVVIVDVITVAVLARLWRREGHRLRDVLGAIRLRRDVPVGLLVAALLLVTLIIGSYLGNLTAYQGPPPADSSAGAPPLWLGLWSLLIMPVTVAVAEELLYRGTLLPRLAERWGWWPAAAVVSLAFGLQHAAFSATSTQAVIARVIGTTVAGLVLALLARRLGRLLPLIIGHWLVDVIGLGLPVLLATSLFR